MTTPPGDDPNLPARLRANRIIREGESAIGRSWFQAASRWFDRVRPDVVTDDGIRPENVGQHEAFWGRLMDTDVVPVVQGLLRRVLRSTVTGEPVVGAWEADYLNQVGNRLRGVPDEVYALIVREVETGLARNEGIPDISDRIRQILTASGHDRWPNRATTVARTEALAAVNAGVYNGAVQDAEQRGDVAPMKVWLATEDQRTRPTHNEADGQRTLLTSPFVVGGFELLYPGDPRGPAQEVINCRCSILPVVLGEQIDWTDRQNARGD